MSKISGTHYYSSIDIEVENTDKVTFMKSFIENELLKYFNLTSIDDAPFSVNSLSEILSSVEQITGTMTMFLAGIAAVSLIV
jgi:putative ABC transport system permease protein